MKTLHVLITDDQPGMRQILRKIVERSEGFEVVGEAENGEMAVKMFEQLRPQVVFLDVEMPLMGGVECARRIADIDPTACLVFATAHDQYMKDAFEVYAFDYLIKPFEVARAEETLQRIRISRQQAEQDPVPVVRTAERQIMGLNKLIVRHKEGVSLLDMGDIVLIQREERATAIYTLTERIVTSETLSELTDRLDSQLFFRCHKSYIINLSMVSKVYPYGRWTYVVKLKNTTQDALMTYDKFEEMEKMFSGSHHTT